MDPLDGRAIAHQFSRDNCRSLTRQRLARLAGSQILSLTFAAKTIGSMEDILRDGGDLARDPVKAGEVVDIYQHQSIRRLQHIDTIEIEAEGFPYQPRQFEHLAADLNLLLLNLAVQWRGLGNRVDLLTGHIELDIIAGILDVACGQIVGVLIEGKKGKILWCSH